MIFIAASMSAPYFFHLKKYYQSKIEQLSHSIISEKKRYLSDVINKIILEIKFIQTDTSREYDKICKEVSRVLSILNIPETNNNDELLQNYLDELTQASTQKNINNILNILIYNPSDSHIVFSSNIDIGKNFIKTLNTKNKDLYPAFSKSTSINGFDIYIFVMKDTFQNIVKNYVKDLIRTIRLGEDGYIWINQIINYDGGDDYAIRLVHPNLPHTEGLKLSTSMQDINGNFPYKIELDGVKLNGELYFDYYFKKMNTDQISHKLTYAKLYKPYDWIIATGVYLDDVDDLILKETESMNKAHKNQIFLLGFSLFGVISVSIIGLVAFERHINKLISSYISTIKENENNLQKEKDKVDKALRKLKEVAYIDYLTGLLNRRSMYKRIKEEHSRCLRNNSSFVILLGDIDNFKVLNDTHGHACGDIVLKELSKIMTKSIRKEDSISRWGGEEFLILGTSCNLTRGVSLAEKIRSAIEHHEIIFNHITLKVTMSIGVAVFDPKKSIDEIIKEADTMLYLGKNKGRNCVISSMPSA